MKNLVIVESPTKAKTIGKFLGNGYTIKYSMGHVMDLPKSKLGVDVERNFTPELQIVEDKKKIIAELRAAAKSVDSVILATDPDREGEAIASNIQDILSSNQKSKIKNQKFERIVFHEITEEAIKEALTHPRAVDKNLVDAQIARRVLDRLVGYQISPVLWQKVRRGLSAGRVQSVALRLIVEREREIEKFKKEPYWTIHVILKKADDSTKVEFELVEINNEKIDKSETHTLYDGKYKVTKTTINTKEKADAILSEMKEKSYVVADVIEKQTRRSPYAPYITSTMQQDASRRFGYSGKRTMSLAQKLYEEGYITYHRTDSITLSMSAITSMRAHIKNEYGNDYLPEKPRMFTTKQKNAQEAHEGIRPTKIQVSEEAVKNDLGGDYAKLYDMIWRRAVASQMADAIIESTTVFAVNRGSTPIGVEPLKAKYRLKTNGSVLKFDGFLKVYPQGLQDAKLPKFMIKELLDYVTSRADTHETAPPPRYNDASLIATLEEKSIGRPSTYASIISTIVDRGYVERIDRRFDPTAVGSAVNDFLVENFSTIDDIPFTASMEDDLDKVSNGEKEWETMMKDFYAPFSKKLKEVKDAKRVKIEVETTDEKCPECKEGHLVVRTGKFGKFLSCNKFPDCRFTKPLVEETDVLCPKDGGKVIIKKTRKGRKFFGCSNYPACTFAAWKLEDIKESSKVKMQKSKVQIRS